MNARAQRVEWDSDNKKQIEEVKLLYQAARKEDRDITCPDGKPIKFFNPELEGFIIQEVAIGEHQFSAHIIDESGDRRLIWNRDDPGQVKDALRVFEEYAQKGWKAYLVSKDGNPRRRIRRFVPRSQEIYVDDGAGGRTKKKFARALEGARSIKLLPKTYPG